MIKLNDWVWGETSKYEFIGFVVAKDSIQCRVQITQLYNLLLKKKESYSQKFIVQNEDKLEKLMGYHPEMINELIDMSLEDGDKDEFDRYVTELLAFNEKPVSKKRKLWKN